MKNRETKFNFRVSEEFIARLNKAAEVLDIPASQIAREAITEKLERVAKRNPKLAAELEKVA